MDSSSGAPKARPLHGNATTAQFFAHSQAPRVSTDAVMAQSLKRQYPNLELLIAPEMTCNLLGYAAAGHASFTSIEEPSSDVPSSLRWTVYLPPARRIDGGGGALGEMVVFGKFLYRWRSHEFIVYLVDGRDGMTAYPQIVNFYVLAAERVHADALIAAAGRWSNELHGEVWVFDGGAWQKSAELYRSVLKSSWDNVIMDADMKRTIIDDHLSFFGSRDTYARLKVPWKRGVIYHGPPGNGKTISIKAMMNTLYSRKPEIPTLYVRTLTSVSAVPDPSGAVFPKPKVIYLSDILQTVGWSRIFHPADLQQGEAVCAMLSRFRGSRYHRVRQRKELLPQ